MGGNRAGDVPDWCFVQPCYIRRVVQQVNNQKNVKEEKSFTGFVKKKIPEKPGSYWYVQ